MADLKTCLPLTPASVTKAHTKIIPHIHNTPLLTSQTLDRIASHPNPRAYLQDRDEDDRDTTSATTTDGNTNGHSTQPSPAPKFRLHFKCENMQKIGAFKARGAFHAVLRLIDELGIEKVRSRGVVTHSSGNHAQALSLAASSFHIPAYIVMPKISTPSKIAGTRVYTRHVIFSGSTSTEREEVVRQVIEDTGAILVPPYDHPDIILGQGTAGREMEMQFSEQRQEARQNPSFNVGGNKSRKDRGFDAVIAPIGGGGLLGGIATWFSHTPGDHETITKVFGAEPSFEEADDARRGLAQGKRIEHVKSLTIADGLRTPVGITNWDIVSDKSKVEGIYAVTEAEIKMAMKLVFERMKLVVEPSGVVGLAVVLFNRGFREYVLRQQQTTEEDGEVVWDVGIVFSGGNTTMKAISALFAEEINEDEAVERDEGKIGINGEKKIEDIAG